MRDMNRRFPVSRRFVSMSLLLCLTLIASFSPVAPASATDRQRQATRTTASEQKALTLLDQLLAQTNDFGDEHTGSIKLPIFLSRVADLLWNYDQPRARRLFESAVKASGSLTPTTQEQVLPSDDHVVVRKTILSLVLPRDTAFARRLAGLAFQSYPRTGSKDGATNWNYLREQTALYCQIAKYVAASETQIAAELVRGSFNGFYSQEQVEALNTLRRHDPASADKAFLYALTLIADKPTNLSNKIALLAPYLFPDIQTTEAALLKRSGNGAEPSQVNAAVARKFLMFVFDTFKVQPVAAQTAENNMFGKASFDERTMRELIPHFERHLPDKVVAYRARFDEVVADIEKAGQKDMWDREGEMLEHLFKTTITEWLDMAAAAQTQEEKDHYYSQAAAVLMYRDEDYEQALAVMSKVSDRRHREPLLTQIKEMAAKKALANGDAEKAYRYGKELSDGYASVRILVDAARLFVKRGDTERAKAILDEAQAKLGTVKHDSDKASLMVHISSVAAEVSAELGFQKMKAAVGMINAVDDLKGQAGGISVNVEGKIYFPGSYEFDDTFAPLGRADFDRAVGLTKTLKSKESALLAQFAVCKGVLQKSGVSPTKR